MDLTYIGDLVCTIDSATVTVEEIIGCEGMDGNSDYIPAIEIE
jgi:hypothetical protein